MIGRHENHALQESQQCSRRGFPVVRIGRGATVHYVDDYRHQPGRTLCGRWLSETASVDAQLDAPLCKVCVSAGDDYPTEPEFRQYHRCTECGVDTWTLGEAGYTVGDAVWRAAYPLYATGIGVGSTRPCVGCLEIRLGRALVAGDIILPRAPEPGASDRLNSRIAGVSEERPAAPRKLIGRFLPRLFGRDHLSLSQSFNRDPASARRPTMPS